MPDRWGEQLAKAAFRTHLATRGIPTEWRSGREPPDFYMKAGSRSFGVEVTSAMESLQVGSRTLPTQALRAELERIPKRIEAAAGGGLSGTYAMNLAPIPDLKRRLAAIETAALEYIRSTRSAATARRLDIAQLPGGRTVSIEKVGPTGAYVGCGYVLAHSKRAPQMVTEVRAILSERLKAKRLRLRRLRLPRVLLLVDSYSFAESRDWKVAAAPLAFDGFHTVVRVGPASQCGVLHSEDDGWRADV